MKILLTGAGGFLGKKIAASLLEKGEQDIRLHFRQQPPKGFLEELSSKFPAAIVEPVFANLLNRSQLEKLVDGVDCVIHAAAGMRGAAADMFASSVIGTRNLLDAIGNQKVKRVVLISSFSVYQTVDLKAGSLITEDSKREPDGPDKGPYGYAKARQETLFRSSQEKYGFEAIILRPGVIYGPGGGAFSSRVGIRALGFFFSLGGRAILPLTYVDNCADAVALAAIRAPNNSVFNVVDDDLPTCNQYLRKYRGCVARIRTLPIPYWALLLGSRALARYHRTSKGQLPAIFTPYIVRSMYRGFQYSNVALKNIGWQQGISTLQGMEISFDYWREHI